MFQKFKDKLAEEMKQSPARLQASMQQMAQAVISPAQSNSSIQELPITVESKDLTKKTDGICCHFYLFLKIFILHKINL